MENNTLKWSDVLQTARHGNPTPDRRVEKTESEWREILDEETFRITRKHGTERPFSSEMCTLFEPAVYGCACCKTPLFDAHQKFDSGTGWPSFTIPMKDNVIAYKVDTSFGMQRVETLCNVCDAHLGHVFPDGPPPTGLRFCINALSLKKIEV